jgi:hypothetical protein
MSRVIFDISMSQPRNGPEQSIGTPIRVSITGRQFSSRRRRRRRR